MAYFFILLGAWLFGPYTLLHSVLVVCIEAYFIIRYVTRINASTREQVDKAFKASAAAAERRHADSELNAKIRHAELMGGQEKNLARYENGWWQCSKAYEGLSTLFKNFDKTIHVFPTKLDACVAAQQQIQTYITSSNNTSTQAHIDLATKLAASEALHQQLVGTMERLEQRLTMKLDEISRPLTNRDIGLLPISISPVIHLPTPPMVPKASATSNAHVQTDFPTQSPIASLSMSPITSVSSVPKPPQLASSSSDTQSSDQDKSSKLGLSPIANMFESTPTVGSSNSNDEPMRWTQDEISKLLGDTEWEICTVNDMSTANIKLKQGHMPITAQAMASWSAALSAKLNMLAHELCVSLQSRLDKQHKLTGEVSKKEGEIKLLKANADQDAMQLNRFETALATAQKQLKDHEDNFSDTKRRLEDANATILERDQQLQQAGTTMAFQHQGLQNLFAANENLRKKLEDYEINEHFEDFLAESGQDVVGPSNSLMVTSSPRTGHEAPIPSPTDGSEAPATEIADEKAPIDTTEALLDAAKPSPSDNVKPPTGDLTPQAPVKLPVLLGSKYAEREVQKVASVVPKLQAPSPKPKGSSLLNSVHASDKPESAELKGEAPVAAQSSSYNTLMGDPNGRSLMTTTLDLTGDSKETSKQAHCKTCNKSFEVPTTMSDPQPSKPSREILLWDKHNVDFHDVCKYCPKEVSGVWDDAAFEFDFTEHYKVCPKKPNVPRPSNSSPAPPSHNTSSRDTPRKVVGMQGSKHVTNASHAGAGSSTPPKPVTPSGVSRNATPRGAMPTFGKSAASSSTPQGSTRPAPPRPPVPSFKKAATPSASEDGVPASQPEQTEENLQKLWGEGAKIHLY